MAIIKIKNAAGEWEDLVSDSLEDNSPSKALSAKQGKILDESKADKSDTYTKTEVNSLSNGKIDKPTSSTPAGKFMQTDDHGNAIWGDGASGAEVGRVVTAWLEENISGGQTIAIDTSLSVPGAAAESATVGNLLDEIIQVADEEPTDEFNKIWVEETPDSEIEIPDYEDFENLVTVSSDEPTAPANKVWIKPSGLGEVAVTTYEEFTGVIAPDYDTINVAGSMPIKVGQHCIHNGEYYSCKIEITEPETFTLSHWIKMTVGSEASDLKSALSILDQGITEKEVYTKDDVLRYVAYNGYLVNAEQQYYGDNISQHMAESTGAKIIKLPCRGESVVSYPVFVTSGGFGAVFTDSNGIILSGHYNTSSQLEPGELYEINVPINAEWFYISMPSSMFAREWVVTIYGISRSMFNGSEIELPPVNIGTVNAMIDCGYTYVDACRSGVLAYADVPAGSPMTNRNGINCSTFVRQLLQGIPYDDYLAGDATSTSSSKKRWRYGYRASGTDFFENNGTYTAQQIYNLYNKIGRAWACDNNMTGAKPGDIICFVPVGNRSVNEISHIGMYVGKDSIGNQYIFDASSVIRNGYYVSVRKFTGTSHKPVGIIRPNLTTTDYSVSMLDGEKNNGGFSFNAKKGYAYFVALDCGVTASTQVTITNIGSYTPLSSGIDHHVLVYIPENEGEGQINITGSSNYDYSISYHIIGNVIEKSLLDKEVEYINVSSYNTINGTMQDGGYWGSVGNTAYKSALITDVPKQIIIVPSAGRNAYLSFFREVPDQPESETDELYFCEGETNRHVVSAGTTSIMLVPSDCRCVIVTVRSNGTSLAPELYGNLIVEDIVRLEQENEADIKELQTKVDLLYGTTYTKQQVIDKYGKFSTGVLYYLTGITPGISTFSDIATSESGSAYAVKIDLTDVKTITYPVFKSSSNLGSFIFDENDTVLWMYSETTENTGSLKTIDVPENAAYMLVSISATLSAMDWNITMSAEKEKQDNNIATPFKNVDRNMCLAGIKTDILTNKIPYHRGYLFHTLIQNDFSLWYGDDFNNIHKIGSAPYDPKQMRFAISPKDGRVIATKRDTRDGIWIWDGEEFTHLEGFATKPMAWLYNSGVDFINDGTDEYCIFAEYAGTVSSGTALNVWRGKYPYTSVSDWTIVMSKTQITDITHFHMVRRDPWSNVLYLTSGDYGAECKWWYSTDIGATWTQLVTGSDTGWGNSLCRTINFVFTADYIYWATDHGESGSQHHTLNRIARNAQTGVMDLSTKEQLTLLPQLYATNSLCYVESPNGLFMYDRIDTASSSVFGEPIKMLFWDFATEQLVEIASLKLTQETWGGSRGKCYINYTNTKQPMPAMGFSIDTPCIFDLVCDNPANIGTIAYDVGSKTIHTIDY